MPPKTTPTTTVTTGSGKLFTESTVAVLLSAHDITTISRAQYNMMSALDGTRTADSFQHQFRSVVKLAKDLKARVSGGEVFEPVKPGGGRVAGLKIAVLKASGGKTGVKRNADTAFSPRATTPNKKTKMSKWDTGVRVKEEDEDDDEDEEAY